MTVPAPSRPPRIDLSDVLAGTSLGLLALIRPIASITGLDDLLGRPLTPLVLTAAISIVWILAAALSPVPHPFATVLIAAGVYAVASVILSAVLSPVLDGEFRGPLAEPFALVAMIATNAVWGAACGGVALLVRRATRRSPAT